MPHLPALRLARLLLIAVVALVADDATAQILKTETPGQAGPQLGAATVAQYQVGATIRARGPTQNIRIMVALPLECTQQKVRLLSEDFSPQVEVEQRVLKTGEARQMLIYIPQLRGGESAHALITFEVETHALLPPTETTGLRIPGKSPRELKQYLGRSPYIDTDHRAIRSALQEAWAPPASPPQDEAPDDQTPDDDGPERQLAEQQSPDHQSPAPDDQSPIAEESATEGPDAEGPDAEIGPTDWERVEAIYDYVLDHVIYEEGADQSAVQVLERGKGDCQAIGALFVALCRTAKIPARLVWVHGHQYAEFYLEDEEGTGQWYPIETAGQRAFGEMPVARVILQKGDNFRVPERRRERLRYASDYALFLSTAGTKPTIKYVRKLE